MAVIKPFSVKPASFNSLQRHHFPAQWQVSICSGVTNSSENVFNTAPDLNHIIGFPAQCLAGSPAVVGNLLISSVNLWYQPG
jgi:hypothetical protein